ncbi:MAG: hypothetical protein ACREK5_06460 [Gemmatimonadota bacterium]
MLSTIGTLLFFGGIVAAIRPRWFRLSRRWWGVAAVLVGMILVGASPEMRRQQAAEALAEQREARQVSIDELAERQEGAAEQAEEEQQERADRVIGAFLKVHPEIGIGTAGWTIEPFERWGVRRTVGNQDVDAGATWSISAPTTRLSGAVSA